MGSRKDLIKRSLGITEYPWSSDDDLEEEATLAAEGSNLRRPPEARPSMADSPGTSGLPPSPSRQQHQQQQMQQQHPQQHQQQHHPQQHHQQHHHHQQQQQQQQHQQQQAAGRRNQARLDRDLFWSIINTPQRSSGSSSRLRASDIPVSYVSRVNHVPVPEAHERGERGAARAAGSPADIQHILAFKRLTRNFPLRHRGHIAGVIPVTRVNPGVIVPSEANSSIRINRHHLPIRRFVRAGPCSPLPPLRPGQEIFTPYSDVPAYGLGAGAGGAAGARDEPGALDERLPPHAPPADNEINNNPAPALADTAALHERNVEQDVPLEGELEAESPPEDLSVANVAMEEEIVPMDLVNPDAAASEDERERPAALPAAPAPAPASADAPDGTGARFAPEYHRPPVDLNMASTSDAPTEAVEPTSPNQGVKRKRRDSDESLEPYTVKEFNLNLLRLLECPVCLEWMEPPMSQCRRGHLVCGRCRARLAACPVCRTTFSSVRNRAMEGVAELLRYPCRHGCGREVRLRRRAPHEASCAARKYQCPAPACADTQPLPRAVLAQHFQSSPPTMEGTSSPSVGATTSPLEDEDSLLPPDDVRQEFDSIPRMLQQSMSYLQSLHIHTLNVTNEFMTRLENAQQFAWPGSVNPPSNGEGESLPPQHNGASERPHGPGLAFVSAHAGFTTNSTSEFITRMDNFPLPSQISFNLQSSGEVEILPPQDNGPSVLSSVPDLRFLETMPGISLNLSNEALRRFENDPQIVLMRSANSQNVGEGRILPPQHNGVSERPRGRVLPYLEALRAHALNVVQQQSSQGNLPQPNGRQVSVYQRTDEGEPLPLQNDEPSQSNGPDLPYTEALREHAVNVANESSQENPPQPNGGQGSISNRLDGEREHLPSLSEEPSQRPNGPDLPYTEALREHTVNVANESSLREEYLPGRVAGVAPLPLRAVHSQLAHNFNAHMREVLRVIQSLVNELESRHLPMMKIGRRHKFSMMVNTEQHDNWLILAIEEYFHLKIDVDIHTWGVIVYVSYIGPKCDAKNYVYEVTVDGQHNQRKLTYARTTHSDLESSSLNVSRQDCFHLTLDQALNFIRFGNRHCDADKFLDFNVEISKVDNAGLSTSSSRDEEDS